MLTLLPFEEQWINTSHGKIKAEDITITTPVTILKTKEGPLLRQQWDSGAAVDSSSIVVLAIFYPFLKSEMGFCLADTKTEDFY